MRLQSVTAVRGILGIAVLVGTGLLASAAFVQEYKSGIVWPEPKQIDPGGPESAPSDATVLFNGTDLAQWEGGEKWTIEDGVATAKGGGIATKDSFGDVQLHLEWASPDEVKGSGQGRGNSGVYFMGKYEIQILDSYENQTYFDGQAASLYKQSPPLVNASRPPGEWQSFDIVFEAPRFDDHGTLVKPGYVTVLHNGVLVQNHTEILGSTAWHKPPEYERHGSKGPISLQFHGNPVRFRNIWVREIEPLVPKRPE